MIASKPSATQVLSEREILTGFQKHLWDLLHSSKLEYTMAVVILATFGLIVVETNIRAQDTDNEIPAWMEVASWIILGLFTLECTGRLFLGGCRFFRDPWNIFDFFIIYTDLIFSVIAEVFASLLPTHLLRILRMAKICRISKVFRIFPELRLMIGGLIGAMRAIFWGAVLMVIAMLICAVLAVQFIHPLNKKLAEQGMYDGCFDCHEKFASVQNAVVTFWQQILAGDSWGQVTLPIIHTYPLSIIYFALVFLLLAVALQNLILGVIVDVAQETRKKLQQDDEKQKIVLRMESQTHLLEMCRDMDTDDSGELTKDELFEGYKENGDFRKALQELDIQYADLDVVWLLLDRDHSGSVDYDEFVTELYNLRSSESQFMITYIKYYVTVIKDVILEKIQLVEDGMEAVQKEVMVVENLEKQRRDDEEEMEEQRRSRRVSKEATNAYGGTQCTEQKAQQKDNENHGMERPTLHASEALFNDLVEEIRQSEHRVTAMLEAMNANVEFSISEQMQKMRGSSAWSLGLPCNSPSSGPGKVLVQTPSSNRQLVQTPADGIRRQTDRQQADRLGPRVFTISDNGGAGARPGNAQTEIEGGDRWH